VLSMMPMVDMTMSRWLKMIIRRVFAIILDLTVFRGEPRCGLSFLLEFYISQELPLF